MNSTGLTKKGCRCVPYTSLKSGSSVLRGTPDLETVCWSGVNRGGQRSFMGEKAGQVLQGVVLGLLPWERRPKEVECHSLQCPEFKKAVTTSLPLMLFI